MIYFDSAATTLQKPDAVPAAVAGAMSTITTPGRGDHPAARLAADLMLRCRMEAAELFDVPQPDNAVLTTSATHGLNIAIRSLVRAGDTVVISGYEHNAVTRTLADIGGVSCRIVNAALRPRPDGGGIPPGRGRQGPGGDLYTYIQRFRLHPAHGRYRRDLPGAGRPPYRGRRPVRRHPSGARQELGRGLRGHAGA